MWSRVVFLSILAAIGVISATLCAPALPFIADHFSTHFSHIQFTISLFLVGNAFGQLISGPLSDQIGQRTVLLGGLFLYILASCGCALSDQMWVLLTARFFQGMGTAAGPVLSRAIASREFPGDRFVQIQSYTAMGIGIASIFAILCSGQLTLFSWRGNFWLAAALGIILFLWASSSLKKAPLLERERFSFTQIFSQMWHILKQPRFLSPTLCHSMTYGLMYGYITLFPFLLIEIFQEKNPARVGLYSAYMIGFYMLGAFLAARLVVKWKLTRMITLGLILQLASGGLLIFCPVPLWIIAILSLFNFSIGIILPLTSASALAPFGRQSIGTASSSLGLSYRLIGSLLSTLICQFPLAGGKALGMAIFFLSLGSLMLFKQAASKKLA